MITFVDLKERKCKPCEGGIPPLPAEDIHIFLKQVKSGWEVIDGKKIKKGYSFVNFKHSMDFVMKVALISEEEGHHPVININFGKVIIELWTFAINGLSENDFILAAKIDEIPV